MSAEGDIANLRDFEDQVNPDDLALYQTALAMLKCDGEPSVGLESEK